MWRKGDPDQARHSCLGCGIAGTEEEWKLPNYAERQPGCSAADAAAAGLAHWLSTAQGGPEKLKVFFNNILGESYAETMTVMVSADALSQRAERYPLI